MGSPRTLRDAAPRLTRLLKFLSPHAKPNLRILAGAFAALFAGIVMRALEPWPLKVIFDYVIVPIDDGALATGGPAAWSSWSILSIASLSLVVIVALRAASNYYSKVGFALAGSRVMTTVRGELFNHIHSLSLSFHNRARTGDLIVRMIGDIGMLKQVAVTAFMPMLASLLVLVVMAVLMLWLNWQLALLILITLPLYWMTTAKLGRRIQAVSRKQRQREGAMAATAAESLGAIQSVQALSLGGVFSDLFSSQNMKSLKDGVKARKLASKLQGLVLFMTGASTAVVLWFGARQVVLGRLTPGELLVFLSYLKAAFRPMQDFSKYAGRLAKASASGDRVMEMMNLTPDIRDLPGAVETPELIGAIEFDHITFSYGPSETVLNKLSLGVRSGETLALVGSSGAGKSTILNLVPRLYDPDPGCGVVMIDGIDIRNWKLDSLRRQISVVLQDTALFAASVRDNIALGQPELTDEDIINAARIANAHDFITAMPQGYDSLVGERGVTLSVGQRQRVAIARAAARKSPILLLDEPTVSLDGENERAVIEALERVADDRTTILITHNLKHAARADVIAVIEDGAVVEHGTHNDLMNLRGHYARLYQTASAQEPTAIKRKAEVAAAL